MEVHLGPPQRQNLMNKLGCIWDHLGDMMGCFEGADVPVDVVVLDFYMSTSSNLVTQAGINRSWALEVRFFFSSP